MPDEPDPGFLPPEPPGPEPELGQRPTPPPAEQQHTTWQQPPGQWQPPPGQQAPPGQQWQQPHAGQAPPPGGWQPPPPGWPPQQPPAWGQPQWAYPQEPDNNAAITGFVLAMVSLGLWFFTAGFSSVVSIGLAIAGLVYSRKGKRKVAAGETRKHKGLAQAGYISSIVMIVLATLATIAWTAFWIVFATDEDFRNDLDDGNDNGFGSDGISATVRLGAIAARLTATLLS
jgi:hypothetical protein